MFEQQMIELFLKFGPDSDGVLERASLAELNVKLAKWYCKSEALQEQAPPPEPLPTDALRLPAFRLALCRVLTSLNMSPEDKSKFLAKLLEEPREPVSPSDIHEDGRRAMGAWPALSYEARHAVLLEDERVHGQAQCWAPTTGSAAELVDTLSSLFKDASGQDANEVREKLAAAAKAYSSTALAAAKDVLQTANEYGVTAVEASKVYGERAMEYGEKVLSSRKPAGASGANAASQMHLLPQQSCSKLPAYAPPPRHYSEDCIGDSLLGTRGLPTLLNSQEPSSPSFTDGNSFWTPWEEPSRQEAPAKSQAWPERLGEASGSRASSGSSLPPSQAPAWPKHLQDAPARDALATPRTTATSWRYDAGDGLVIHIRSGPELDSDKTGRWLSPGEVFEVSRELRDGDAGVTFLKLADGRGWLFDRKPGVGVMCRRQ